ncbi:MAG: FAD-binding protein [Coriobacteriales bacterium]|nr:FAD-binding protein [Coriobacteriales bacterium]
MKLDRRSFIQGSAVMGGAMMLGGAVAPALAEQIPAPKDYMAAPEPIGDDQISETFEAELVIIGAGASGSVACATAAENGASVIVLQKAECVFTHGSGFAACGTKIQAEKGIETPDPWKVLGDIAREAGANLGKWEVLKLWADYGAEMGDWLVDKFEDSEYGPFLIDGGSEFSEPWNRNYPVPHLPRGTKVGTGNIMAICTALVDEAVATGLVDVKYETPAVQLRQDESGRVTGVIAKNPDGNYILCNATKGVIIAAGGYEGNAKMREDFLGQAIGLGVGYSRPELTQGDGILMAIWAGGRIQRLPHCSNIHYDPGILVPTQKGTTIPWLRVNKLGKRFSNEDVCYDSVWAQDIRQPGCMHYQIFDDNYLEDLPNIGKGMTQYGKWETLVPDGVANGDIYCADTIEQLAEMIEVPVENFVATVERYNELADIDAEYEPDFGKLAYKVKKIQKPPFYAIPRQATCLTSLSGLEIDGNLHVLNADNEPIPGLFACGNSSGNFFGGVYQSMSTPCMSIGRAFVTARVAAWRALGIDK